ncbi:hypothetical protein AUEXF2481DRAFT_2692 [Aureobasidium subglaciale EXF-2481]|uniref:GET complex subunit GET2 n=1 Tax=Aureobasidium subglaciale (strain EXF-2481) TaxID=1043005 RepID=A0A074YIY9_AURSE|nr:uncharacterized protein AUEXF2481DRAFT_2692 [Aureobasidium subglaciale EXF-2481]KAI5197196.1 hypothetical protein E4T38_08134 [Aureobasidium subglaciale]KAI5215868.1 hypothetical protein E4T40_08144 [Aureobasidium subglaciale]KAI5219182.1 hypothetical protein E4T41_08046 [Aureobasidium subglaciale]KAI5256627.1 hypothetical protein E4T46_08035 [Aureobasidium subglaciale]KEQ97763.1 hypothetical protein AUEXF2481DRAFT_2692 [Aureobasidium subglaciale EXF-2481]
MADVDTESPAQRAARLRREKRNAKIQTEGSDRLARITQLSGRPAPAPEEPSMTQTPTKPAQATSTMTPQHASIEDPDEVDISEHYWTPTPSEQSQLARLQHQQQQSPFPRPGGQQDEDPMLKMMQSLLSGDPSAAGGIPDSAMDDLPPMLKAMMQGQRTTQQQASSPTGTTYLWRVVHAVFALALGIYIAASGTFHGSKMSRNTVLEGSDFGPRLFYMFATAEVVLQSSRYYMEKGRLQGSGWLATIANSGLVPQPYSHYISMAGRYAVIWQTVVADAMVVVFVLGCLAWWNGTAAA